MILGNLEVDLKSESFQRFVRRLRMFVQIYRTSILANATNFRNTSHLLNSTPNIFYIYSSTFHNIALRAISPLSAYVHGFHRIERRRIRTYVQHAIQNTHTRAVKESFIIETSILHWSEYGDAEFFYLYTYL